MLIRSAVLQDAPQLAAVHVAAWRAGHLGTVPDVYLDELSVERLTANWARHPADPGHLDVLVGELGGVVTGCTGRAEPGRRHNP